jgi:hypothetical protein
MNTLTGFARQALLLDLISKLREAGSWTGETHVQKCCYVLQQGLGVPMGFEFFLYKHGPFSFDLRDLLSDMCADLLIEVEPRPPYGGSLAVQEPGIRLMEGFPSVRKSYQEQVEFVASSLWDMGVAKLERLGTALYVQTENPSASRDELAARLHAVKRHIPEPLALEAIQEVQRLLEHAPIV